MTLYVVMYICGQHINQFNDDNPHELEPKV